MADTKYYFPGTSPLPHKPAQRQNTNTTLRREYLNAGGYTSSGCYFGRGKPLYWYCVEHGDGNCTDGYTRAATRQAAKDQVTAAHPGAKFHRQ